MTYRYILPLLILTLLAHISVLGQEAQSLSPNRMLIVNDLGQFVTVNIDHVRDIRFAYVDQKAECGFQVTCLEEDRCEVWTSPGDECHYYRIGMVPVDQVAGFEYDLEYISLAERRDFPAYYGPQEIILSDNGELQPKASYEIISVAYDRYGTADGVCHSTVTVPPQKIVGNPAVDIVVSRPAENTVEVKFVPNSDTTRFYFLFGVDGRYEYHFEVYHETLGFDTMEEMIVGMGVMASSTFWQTWNMLRPDSTYELLVVCLDKNYNAAPMQRFTISGSPGNN